MLTQEQLSLVSSYAGQIAKQMNILGTAYTDSRTFVAELITLSNLCDILNKEIINEVKLLTNK